MNSNAVRWSILLVVVAIASGAIYNTYLVTRPCARPISYAIGAVDARFDISNASLVENAKFSANIWNTAVGKNLLVYDPKAALKINLVYDEREENAKLGSAIALQQADMDSAHAILEGLQAQYAAAQSAYNQKVSAINARGGASRSEQKTLAAERESLNALSDSLKSRVALYNASVTALNNEVRRYNQSTGRTFEQGQYVQDSAGERINVFTFVGAIQLKRVLAHEFGHAIGLDHNDDSKSIMFAKNESGNLIPTSADLSALRSLCGA